MSTQSLLKFQKEQCKKELEEQKKMKSIIKKIKNKKQEKDSKQLAIETEKKRIKEIKKKKQYLVFQKNTKHENENEIQTIGNHLLYNSITPRWGLLTLPSKKRRIEVEKERKNERKRIKKFNYKEIIPEPKKIAYKEEELDIE